MGEKIKKKIGREWNRNKYLYFLCLPFVIYYILFHYGPMSGLLMAFQDYSIVDGIWNSPFIPEPVFCSSGKKYTSFKHL